MKQITKKPWLAIILILAIVVNVIYSLVIKDYWKLAWNIFGLVFILLGFYLFFKNRDHKKKFWILFIVVIVLAYLFVFTVLVSQRTQESQFDFTIVRVLEQANLTWQEPMTRIEEKEYIIQEHYIKGNQLTTIFKRQGKFASERLQSLVYEGTCTNTTNLFLIDVKAGEIIKNVIPCKCTARENYSINISLVYSWSGSEGQTATERWNAEGNCE